MLMREVNLCQIQDLDTRYPNPCSAQAGVLFSCFQEQSTKYIQFREHRHPEESSLTKPVSASKLILQDTCTVKRGKGTWRV